MVGPKVRSSGGGWLIDYGGIVEDVREPGFVWGARIIDDSSASSLSMLDCAYVCWIVPSTLTHLLPEFTLALPCLLAKIKRKKLRLIVYEVLPYPVDKLGESLQVQLVMFSSMIDFDAMLEEDKSSNIGSLKKRFTELCSIMNPGKPPITDKFVILSDAAHFIKQLRHEAKRLKESNEALQNSIKSVKLILLPPTDVTRHRERVFLSTTGIEEFKIFYILGACEYIVYKGEKLELRNEKMRLKSEKERIEQMLKGSSTTTQFFTKPAATTLQPASPPALSKTIPYPNHIPTGMWQWIPTAAMDTSLDHVLRPPAA
ncbi:hypothetical protein ZIOFF_016271 [Zingiber officinale]|uniref:BHLH domain-containing protein n=1 Tax=Zingiber officinale TaxID=94328 RepID=A0A8J5LV30_ZINOF|nr:hypothetical protein ZIOFF_016271 [Zingiber officinale]